MDINQPAAIAVEWNVHVSVSRARITGVIHVICKREFLEQERETTQHQQQNPNRTATNDDDDDDSGDGFDLEDSEEEPEGIDEITEEDKRFIVDEEQSDDDDENNDRDSVAHASAHRHHHKSKRRKKLASDDELDEDDLDLVEENTGLKLKSTRSYKRLKRRKDRDLEDRADARDERTRSDMGIFADDDEPLYNEVDDDNFIVDDDANDPRAVYGRAQAREWRAAQVSHGPSAALGESAHGTLAELFGNGEDYDWVYEAQERASAAKSSSTANNLQYDEYDDEYDRSDQVKLSEVFEPSEVVDKMLTAEDDHIRFTDIPERLQASGVGQPLPGELRESVRCILRILRDRRHHLQIQYEQLQYDAAPPLRPVEFPDDLLPRAVTEVLGLLREDLYEVMFVVVHRQDVWKRAMSEDEVWVVADEDARHSAVYSQSAALTRKCELAGIEDQDHIQWLMDARSPADVRVVSEYLDFMHPRQLALATSREIMENTGYKPPRLARTSYEVFEAVHITELTSQFTITPVQFYENMRSQYRVSIPSTPEMFVENAMSSAKPGSLASDKFQIGYTKYLAQCLSLYPSVRREYLEKFKAKGHVTVVPTEPGSELIQPTHRLFPLKYITNKPLGKVLDRPEQWLTLVDAEAQGHLKIEISMGDPEFKSHVYNCWGVDESDADEHSMRAVSDLQRDWDKFRVDIIALAHSNLIERTVQSIREDLVKLSQMAIADRCAMSLYRLVHVAPYSVPTAPGSRVSRKDKNVIDYPRTLALTAYPRARDYAVQGALVDEYGQLSDQFSDTFDMEGLPAAIDRMEPDVIVLDIGPSVVKFRLVDAVRQQARASRMVPVEIVHEGVAAAFAESVLALAEFPDASVWLRKCIGLGRQLQDAQHVVASLFPGDVLKIPLHPVQHLVPEELLRIKLEHAVVRSVMVTGVDINAARMYPHLSRTLQFAPGLGPRKAIGMLQRMQRMRVISKREVLVTKFGLGPKVMVNSAAFIKIDMRYVDDREVEPLDCTRIDPEDYTLARKMARDAMDMHEIDETDKPSRAVLELWKSRREELINDLSLHDYAAMIEQKTGTRKELTLNLIKDELMNPFAEKRSAYVPMTDGDVIHTVLDESVREGSLVDARVVLVLDKLVRLRLENDVEAIMWPRNIVRDGDFATVVKEGQMVRAVVLEIDSDRLCLSLSMTDEAVSQATADQRKQEPYFDESKLAQEQDRRTQRERAQVLYSGTGALSQIAPEAANHSLFKPVNKVQAETYLRQRGQTGEALVRPSSRPEVPLVLSWLVVGEVVQHVDISFVPGTKKYMLQTKWTTQSATSSMANAFDELDEILYRYVEACARHVEKVVAHRKYAAGTRDHLVAKLSRDVQANPGIIAYGIACHPEFPGHFYLSWSQVPTVVTDAYFKVVPQGYIFNDREYVTVEQVINAFKNGFNVQR